MIMTRQEIEEWVDQLARKYGELACKYVETHDDKKIVEELYELVRELEKLKNEIIGLETQGLAPGSSPVTCNALTREEIEEQMDKLARKYVETHDPEIPEEIYKLAR
jgi:low affinity Fe/Cu permease